MSALRLVKIGEDASCQRTAREARRLVLWSLAFLVAAFGIVGTWSVLAELNGAVVAAGVMKVLANTKLVQHPEGGIVRRIYVKEGDHVAAGTPIVELEDVEANAAMQALRDQLDAEEAKQARLQAEIAGAARIAFPPALLAKRDEPTVHTLLASEETLFRTRLDMLGQQAEKMREQKSAIEAQIESVTQQIAAADKSLTYLNEQEQMNETLHAQKFVSNARLLDAKRTTAEKEEKRYEFESVRAEAKQRLADVEMRLQNLKAARLAESSKDLVDTQSRILNLRERLKPAQDALERRIVRAPESGTVNVLHAHTEGGVVAPRETIAEIVPDHAQLVAEVRVNPADIEEVHVGQPVEVELAGLNRRVTPLLRGSVTFVSPDLNTDTAQPTLRYFIARATISDHPPNGVALSPGMPIATYIRTRERSPLELWLDPVIGAIRHSLRES